MMTTICNRPLKNSYEKCLAIFQILKWKLNEKHQRSFVKSCLPTYNSTLQCGIVEEPLTITASDMWNK